MPLSRLVAPFIFSHLFIYLYLFIVFVFVFFQSATETEGIFRVPTSLAELSRISGVGENKLAKYGDGILAVLAES